MAPAPSTSSYAADGIIDREAMRDQRLDVESPLGEHVEHGFEVALLRPAHESDRDSRRRAPRTSGS